jgi:predicted transcriptional regulator
MRVRREYRNREEIQVAVLDALVDRAEEGMTVFELRAAVDADIDTLETALADLNDDDLITVQDSGEQVVIVPADHVIPDPADDPDADGDASLFDAVRDKLGL